MYVCVAGKCVVIALLCVRKAQGKGVLHGSVCPEAKHAMPYAMLEAFVLTHTHTHAHVHFTV